MGRLSTPGLTGVPLNQSTPSPRFQPSLQNPLSPQFGLFPLVVDARGCVLSRGHSLQNLEKCYHSLRSPSILAVLVNGCLKPCVLVKLLLCTWQCAGPLGMVPAYLGLNCLAAVIMLKAGAL